MHDFPIRLNWQSLSFRRTIPWPFRTVHTQLFFLPTAAPYLQIAGMVLLAMNACRSPSRLWKYQQQQLKPQRTWLRSCAILPETLAPGLESVPGCTPLPLPWLLTVSCLHIKYTAFPNLQALSAGSTCLLCGSTVGLWCSFCYVPGVLPATMLPQIMKAFSIRTTLQPAVITSNNVVLPSCSLQEVAGSANLARACLHGPL